MVPARLIDTPIDYESLNHVGRLWPGGMVVLDETDCMVDIARYFVAFTQDQLAANAHSAASAPNACLNCWIVCVEGQGKAGDIEKLIELGHLIQHASLCGWGKTAPNPVLSTIEYFREEYEAIFRGDVRPVPCRALIHYTITDKCIGCTICAQQLPVGGNRDETV